MLFDLLKKWENRKFGEEPGHHHLFFGKALQGTKAVKDPIAPSMISGMKTNPKKRTAKKQSQKLKE